MLAFLNCTDAATTDRSDWSTFHTVVWRVDTEADSWMRAIDQALKGHEDTGGQGMDNFCIITSHARMMRGNAYSRVCLSVSVSAML